MVLRLEVTDFAGPTQWSWRLQDGAGRFLADHAVSLDSGEPEYDGFLDPERFVRWNSAPDDPPDVERKLVERLSRWIGEHVWGDVGAAIVREAEAAPVVVNVQLPAAAELLLFRPLELACIGDAPLGRHDVSLVYDVGEATSTHAPQPVGARLRMLALFSVPTDHTALNVRYERHELRKLLRRVALTSGAAIELRVLEYGVTRQLLDDVLAEREGWDIIHFSGHGLPAGILLERADGTADVVATDELAQLLRPARAQLKLVTLSSCESAAATIAESRRLLGLSGTRAPAAAEVDGPPLPAVAVGLTKAFGCAALAMRYPVEDGFAVDLSHHLYEALIRHQQPLSRALQLALHHATDPTEERGASPLSIATPVLFGAGAADLTLQAPLGPPIGFGTPMASLAHFPSEPELFVGRVGPLARASATLAPDSKQRGVVFHGMAGAGKTACALELVYRHERGRFDGMAWYRAPLEGSDIGPSLADFAIDLETQLEELELAHVVDDVDQLQRFLPRLTHLLHERSVLVVVDNVESLLTAQGAWRDERWGMVVDAMLRHDGLSRVVLTSRLVPAALADAPRVLVEPVGSLSPDESILLARQLPHLGGLIEGRGMESPAEARELARRTLETAQGNPKLIEFADRQARTPAALRDRLAEARAAWGERAEHLSTFFVTGEADEDALSFLRMLRSWTAGASARLPEDARLAFHVLCAVEAGDRRWEVLYVPWTHVWRSMEQSGTAPPLDVALDLVADQGLLEVRRGDDEHALRYHVHPAIEQDVRDGAPEGLQATVDRELCAFWSSQFENAADGENPEVGQVLIRAGLAATPYALRLGRDDDARRLLEEVIGRDQSRQTLAAVLPLLEQLAERAAGTPQELATRVLLLQARGHRDPHAVLPELRALFERVRRDGDAGQADWLADILVGLLRDTGGLREALRVNDALMTSTQLDRWGPWTQVSVEVTRLQILQSMGEPPLQIQAQAIRIQERIAELEQAPASDRPERVSHWEIREALLDVSMQAALNLLQFEHALTIGQWIVDSKRRRGAPLLQQAEAAFNLHVPLVRLEHYEQADELLRTCRSIFEREGARQHIALVLSGCAELEYRRERFDAAIDFERRSLRLRYALKDPELVLTGHNNLASYLQVGGGDAKSELAHRLAAALLANEIQSGHLTETILVLSEILTPDGAGISYRALCAALGDDLDLAGLVASLLGPGADGSSALRAVIEQARRFDALGHLKDMWEPVLEAAAAVAAGDVDRSDDLEEFLEAFVEETPEFSGLADAIRSIVAGERDPTTSCAGLHEVEAMIVRALLDRL